jgi:hypothetical protein
MHGPAVHGGAVETGQVFGGVPVFGQPAASGFTKAYGFAFEGWESADEGQHFFHRFQGEEGFHTCSMRSKLTGKAGIHFKIHQEIKWFRNETFVKKILIHGNKVIFFRDLHNITF